MDLKKKISRRQFIGQANCAAVGTASLVPSITKKQDLGS